MDDSTTPYRFFVYLLKRPDGRPFYVGKGTERRPKRHEVDARRGCECRRCRTIRKIWRDGGQITVEFVCQNVTEEEAFQVEIETINRIGRKHLCNHTDGGGGTTGLSIERHPSHLYPGIRRADRNGRARFTWEIVRNIRARYAIGGISAAALAIEYETHQTCISKIVRNETWNDPNYTPPTGIKNIPDRRGEKSPRASLTWKTVHAMRVRFASELITIEQLAQEFGQSPTNTARVIRNESWVDPSYAVPDVKRRLEIFRRSTDEQDAEMRALYESGWSYGRLAQYFHRSSATVWNTVNRKRKVDG